VDPTSPRLANVTNATDVSALADLLHDFNTEFDTPSPGPAVLAGRLHTHLAGESMAALLIEEPAAGFALLSLRPNVWYPGPVALLDELYVRPGRRDAGLGTALLQAACRLARDRQAGALEINVDSDDVAARRFYERHGFRNSDPGREDQLLYYYLEF
jgi:GNAT superfamily N-acetyltransferase